MCITLLYTVHVYSHTLLNIWKWLICCLVAGPLDYGKEEEQTKGTSGKIYCWWHPPELKATSCKRASIHSTFRHCDYLEVAGPVDRGRGGTSKRRFRENLLLLLLTGGQPPGLKVNTCIVFLCIGFSDTQ